MTEQVRLPRLLRRELDGSGRLKEAGRLHPTALWAEMNLFPLSRAGMTLTEEDLPVGMHDLVEIFGQNGSLGIFRVVGVETGYGRLRQVQLNHALDLLADVVLPSERDTGSAAALLGEILAGQTETLDGEPYWRLGTVEDTGNHPGWEAYSNAMECLANLAGEAEDCDFSFDFGVFPWRLDFLRRDETVMSEFRLPRNVENCRVTLEDGALCTRLYLLVESSETDADGEKITVTQRVYDNPAGQAAWGVVSKKAGIRAADVPDVGAWVQRYFARHGQPAVQIEIDGSELNRLTGERLDAVRLGRMCRVALPDYGTALCQRVVSVVYPDLLREPRRVRVSLTNKRAGAEGLFARLAARSDAAERTLRDSRVKIVNSQYSLVRQDRHITEQGVILHAAGLELDAHGVLIFATEEGVNTALGAKFSVQAGEISSVVTKTGINSLGQNETLYSRIRQNAEEIELRAKIITLDALQTMVKNLMTGVTTAQSIRVTRLVVKGNGCDWFTVNANNGVFRLLGTYDE